MRILKACVRCNGAFLATVNMLVCERCYGSPDDHEMARVIKQAELLHAPTDAYSDVVRNFANKMGVNSRGV
jgi:hypothetical protein